MARHEIVRRAWWMDGKLWHSVECVQCPDFQVRGSLTETYYAAAKHTHCPDCVSISPTHAQTPISNC